MIVGLDVGGTNIDAVIISNHQVIHTIKVPMDPDDLSGSIVFALDSLLSTIDPKKVNKIHLSTTVSTNAIVTHKLSKVGLIIQSGPGINLDSRLVDFDYVLIDGYVNHQGVVVKKIDEKQVYEAVAHFKSNDIDYVSIITKFSTRNPHQEQSIERLLENKFKFVTCGHILSDNLNFPRRIFTAYLNASVYLSFKKFNDSLMMSLSKYNLNTTLDILKADGGTMGLDQAVKKPIETILSGPAASLMGMMALTPMTEDAICLDIGGTTTDIFFLADGVPLFEPQGASIDSYSTLVRAIDCTSIGLGGDSKVERIEGRLIIGPERDGKPFAHGGPQPTPTDAMIVLGLLEVDDLETQLKASQAMELLNHDESTIDEVANNVLETMVHTIQDTVVQLLKKINSKPVYTIKELLLNKKIQPKAIHIIGAPAKSIASTMEQITRLPVIIPDNYEVANAIGAALATTTMDISLVANTQQRKLTVAKLNIQKTIAKDYNLQQAKEDIVLFLMEATSQEEDAIEITEANSFLMVKNGVRVGNNIRVKAQIKPGYISFLRGDNNETKK